MNYKLRTKIRNTILILIALVILIPTGMYISNLDWGKHYTGSVEALPLYDGTQTDGIYRVSANDMEFKMRVAGLDHNGDNIIFLHGFPQSSLIWEPIINEAAAQGHKVMAFDQRGYSPGARPKGTSNYKIDHLVADLLAVADAVGFDTFHLVGHDWGASVGWMTVMDHPERIHTWSALAIPHIAIFQDALRNDPDQQERSGYMSKLRAPLLPEFVFVAFKNKVLQKVEGVWRPEEVSEVKDIISEHGAATSILNWYRAWDITDPSPIFNPEITRPALYIWGNKDEVVAPHIIPRQNELMQTYYKEAELDAGHSLVQEQGEQVFQLLLEHWERGE